MIYSSLKIDLQPTPKRRIFHWSRGNWTAIYKKARYFVACLLEAELLIHQLINYGMKLRICSSILNSIPQNSLVVNLTPGKVILLRS